MRRRSADRTFVVVVVVLAACAPRAAAVDDQYLAAAPADAVAFVLVDTTAWGDQDVSALHVAATGLEYAGRMGLLSHLKLTTRLWLDGFAAWPVLTNQPFTVILGDIKGRTYGNSHRLGAMELGLVLHTDNGPDRIAGTIQQFINRFTNSTVAGVDEQPGRPGEWPRYRLVDARLPDWAPIQWGRVRRDYVVTLGRGAFERFDAPARSLSVTFSTDVWLHDASRALDGTGAAAIWSVNFDRLRSSLSDPLGDVSDRVLEALGYADVRRAVWVLAREGNGLRIESMRLVGDRSERVTIASPVTAADLAAGVIPPQASTYAAVRWNAAGLYDAVWEAYLAARSEPNAARLRRRWEEFQKDLNFSIKSDLLEQLGDRIIVHTWPPHPLGFEALCTFQIEITGSWQRVRSTIDTLMGYWQRRMDAGASADGGSLIRPSLHHDDDGLWYWQFGLFGPAVSVQEGWIMVSYSPHAVRANGDRLTKLMTMEAPKPAP